MVKIEFNNNKAQLRGDPEILRELFKRFQVRMPNAFFMRKYMPKGWDGKKNYISEYGSFKTGLLPSVLKTLKDLGEKQVAVTDNRFIDFKYRDLEKSLKSIPFRDYQLEAIRAIYENHVMGVHFPIGVLKAATNAGKTYIAVGLFLAFQKKKTLVLLNATDLYDQMVEELEELLPGMVGRIDPKKIDLDKPLIVGRVGTINSPGRKGSFEKFLSSVEVLIVDECDLADNKSYKAIISKAFNSWVRVGMSGTIYEGKLAKYRIPHENIREFLSDQVYAITNRELIDRGYSTEVEVKIIPGNTSVKIRGDYQEEYTQGIVNNPDRNQKIIERLRYHKKQNHLPAIIIVKRKEHVKILYRLTKKEFPDLKVRWIHSGRPGKTRKKVFTQFKGGELDILISSMVTKRGMNLKLLRYGLNAGGGDDPANPLQILGRFFRKHTNKGVTVKYFEDFFDEGFYLKRHSKHRINYYKEQKLKVVYNN